jgi:hypothetical protein
MRFTIQHASPARDTQGNYRYGVYDGGRLIAKYWHDLRGDEHGIDFLSGGKYPWPVGSVVDFMEGGGPEPLALSARAVAYLEQKVPSAG